MCECVLVVQLCLSLYNPMDCSLPGSPTHGIFQARVLEWVAIAFSNSEGSDIAKGIDSECLLLLPLGERPTIFHWYSQIAL